MNSFSAISRNSLSDLTLPGSASLTSASPLIASGKCFLSMTSISVMMSNRSTTFLSSLTFPFQGYFIMASRATGENFFILKLFSSARLWQKYSIRSGISSFFSLRGGEKMGTTLSRK
ncbi:MAG: hypothetical protein QHH14_01340 [Clostridiales bacterium]|nr:hypothetical protein [Clostridiales bacterium]